MTIKHFVFVRHGRTDKQGNDPALTAVGEQQARAAGAFLRDAGVVPDLVLTTKKRRTKETAAGLLAELGRPETPTRATEGGFAKGKSSLEDWLAKNAKGDAQTVLFVGHHSSQGYCASELSPDLGIDEESRVALVYERRAATEWKLVASWVANELV